MERPRIWQKSKNVLTAGLTASALLLAACVEHPEAAPVPHAPTEVSAYVPTYAVSQLPTGEDFRRLTEDLNSVDIAFGLPNADGQVEAPDLSDDYIAALDNLSPDTELRLAVGGWSIDDSREQMENNLQAVFANPKGFVESLFKARQTIAQQLGREATAIGFTLDFEWPRPDQADEMTEIAERISERDPDATLAVAIPAGNASDGFDVAALAPYVDDIHCMTYDFSTPDSGQGAAGYLAPESAVLASIDSAVARAGDASKIVVGFPAYGYRFVGAKAMGQPFKPNGDGKAREVLLKDIDPSKISADGQTLVDGAVVSVVTPDMAKRVMDIVRQRHPRIGGAFIWALPGANRQLIQALK